MTRRKREITGLANEQDFPHLVELALPSGFRGVFLEIDAFHRERRIPVRRGRSRHEAEQFYIRFCFPDTATADAFRHSFGGECLTHAPDKPKPRASSRGEPCWRGRLARFRTIQACRQTASALRRRKACRRRDHTTGDAAMA
jgi:hypothetical protein